MKKKFLALVLTLAMVLSLVPVTALATDGTEGGASQENTRDNLTMKKTVIPNEDGTYTVRLESYATGSVTTTQTPVPMDIVLVLDVSGSMTGEIASYTYQATDKTSWSVSDVYNDYYDWGGLHRTDVTYYAKIGNEYYPVSYKENWVSQGWFSGYSEYWLEANNKPLGKKVTDRKEEVYNQELYTRQTDPNKTTKKLDAMKTAVNNFIESVAAQKNGDTPVAHRISIVKFAGNSKNEVGNNRYNNNKYNYTQKVTELTDVTNDGSVASLKKAVNDLTAGGATAADWGMQKANDVLIKRENKENPSIVIMFTDGEPNHENDYWPSVAGNTVQAAKGLKDGGTKVYTIGMFKDLQPSNADKVDTYMNGVSSNYPEAVKANNNSGVTLGKRAEGNYYFKADNASDLEQVFQTISESTTVTSPLDASAVVVDNVPSNFALNEGSVQVYTADCTGKNSKGELTWKDTLEKSNIIPNIPEDKNEDGSQTISTTGFNFSENWCGLDGDKPHGQKLIIEFTIECTNYGGTQRTNAGAYIKAGKEANEKPIISLEDPEVPVTISLGSNEELLDKLKVEEEKTYNGSGFAILSEVAKKVDALVNDTNKAKNAYVNMELTVTVEGTTYTYKIRAGETAGKWYEGNREMNAGAVSNIKTSPNVKRGEKNAVEPYTYNFNLKLSDKTKGGAKEANYGSYPASFTIKPASVTVTANDQQVEKGTAPASITYTDTVTGLVNGEAENLIVRTIQCENYTVDTPVTSDGSELEITASGDPEQGNYTVTYQPGKLTVTEAPVTTGTLKVTKEVQGDDLTLKSLPSDFKITVTGPNSYNRSFPLPETVGDSDKTVTWTISDLPAGEYTVSETNADVKGYDCTATYSATNGTTVIVNNDASAVQNQPATDAQASKKVTVTENQTSTMTVTNKYTKQQEVEPTPDTSKPDVNKTATDLVNDKTDVTLSVGGKSAKENVAVMFLLDKSTSVGNSRTEAARMLHYLKSLTNTNIIYDVVIFSGTASSTGWNNILDDKNFEDTLKNFANQKTSSGTNMPAGIDQATQDMETLKSQYSSYAENAYLITISDGITYLWNEDGKTYTVPLLQKEGNNIYTNIHPNVDTWDMMYGKGTSIASVYGSFENFLKTIPEKIKKTQDGGYVQDYLTSVGDATDVTKYIQISTTDPEKSQVSGTYACAPEFSVYYSTTKYKNLVKPFTKSFALPMPEIEENGNEKTKNWENYPWGEELMIYLQSMSSNVNQGVVHDADAKTIFAGIQNKILYQIQSGSITDVIGADFSLTDQTLTQNTFTLTANGNPVAANAPNGNVITFGEKDESTGKYPYVLTYYKGTATKNADNTYTITSSDGNTTYTYTPCDKTGEVNGSVSDEFFVLEMNVPVVSLDLKYNLSLTSKRTASGTYEVPTNESATLAYQSANQSAGSVDFNEPTVSYRVKGSSGGHSGGSITIPDDVPTGLNGKDHYAYVVGYPDGMVYPQKNITRAEVATIFFRLLEDETREANMTKSNGYNDMKDGAWYTCAVSTLSKMGIIKGYEDGSFKPDASISRAEFAAIAARFDPDGDTTPATFSDVSSHWAKDEISIAANHGWIKGYEDGSFKPDQKITRAETMTLVNRVLKRLPETKDDLHKDMKTWPDNQNESAWFYLAVQEATNSHYQKLKKDGTHETWESMRETRDWAALEK